MGDAVKYPGGWISAEEKAPRLPCIICTESDNIPRIPDGIVTCGLANGETFYFDRKLATAEVFEYAKKNRCEFFTKENRIRYWMPIPEPPKERKI